MTERKHGDRVEGVTDSESRDLTPEEKTLWSRTFVVAYDDKGDRAATTGSYSQSKAEIRFRRDAKYEMSVHPMLVDLLGRPNAITLNLYRNGIHVQMMTSFCGYDERGLPVVGPINNAPINGYPSEECLNIEDAAIYSSYVIVGLAETEQAGKIAETFEMPVGFLYTPPGSKYEN